MKVDDENRRILIRIRIRNTGTYTSKRVQGYLKKAPSWLSLGRRVTDCSMDFQSPIPQALVHAIRAILFRVSGLTYQSTISKKDGKIQINTIGYRQIP